MQEERDRIRRDFLERRELRPVDHLWEAYGQPFDLLHRGTARGIDHAVTGQARGVPVWMFEYWYVVDTEDANGDRPLHRFDCVTVKIDAWCPSLLVEPRLGPLGSLAEGILFESDEFNRVFKVICEDKMFANAAVDAQLIGWFLDHGRGMTFEFMNDRAMAAIPRGDDRELGRVLDAGATLPGIMPRVIGSLYPHAGPTAIPPVIGAVD